MAVYLHHGEALRTLRRFKDNSVDALVTDPPAGIAFMGSSWDTDKGGRDTWIRWMIRIMQECHRILKPGGHVLVWALPRTSHWTGMAVEDAGFEVRDSIHHIFSQSFPKSLNVSKALDKQRHDRPDIYKVTTWLGQARDDAHLTNGDIDRAFGFNGMAGHWTSQKSQPSIPTLDQVPRLLELLGSPQVPDEIAELLITLNGRKGQPGEAWFRREVIGKVRGGIVPDKNREAPTSVGGHSQEFDITASSSSDARRWEGWGTALKPCHEVWWQARKAFPGTVAQNVMAHGTGALNIAACKVHGSDDEDRWPPNLVLSHLPECDESCIPGCAVLEMDRQCGGASENYFPCFRYQSKPSTSEKAAGLAEGQKASHPTVKPIALMRWLCRLITPPGGTVLDPFMGSGTTGCGAVLEGFSFVGIERSSEFIQIARARIDHWREKASVKAKPSSWRKRPSWGARSRKGTP